MKYAKVEVEIAITDDDDPVAVVDELIWYGLNRGLFEMCGMGNVRLIEEKPMMAVHSFEDLREHVGHDVHVSRYVSFDKDGTEIEVNVAIECETCYEILLDFDKRERVKQVCSTCGSDEVFYDAYVGVNDDGDVRTFDAVFCDNCGGESSLKTEGD